MEENTTKQGLGFVFGLLVGTLIGAATAIIVTPQSGQQTRDQIKAKANEAKAKAGEKAVEFKGKAQAYTSELKEDLGEWTEKAKATVATKIQELKKGKVEETVSTN
jgi:gas vesicle protein